MTVDIKSREEIEILCEGGEKLGSVLARIADAVRPGITTESLDVFARECIEHVDGKPSFLGYHGYPSAVCVSIDEEIVHGLPSPDRTIAEGQIVSIDIGMWYKGLCTDTALTVAVGEIPQRTRELISVTNECLRRGIQQTRAHRTVGDIGHAIQTYAESHGFHVVRDLVGHGVGRKVHEEPHIPNVGEAGEGVELQVGMVIAIEPMVTIGSADVVLEGDHWTYRTKDRSLAAHSEHSVAITADGPLVLTKRV